MQGVVRDRNTIVSVKWSGSERGQGILEVEYDEEINWGKNLGSLKAVCGCKQSCNAGAKEWWLNVWVFS